MQNRGAHICIFSIRFAMDEKTVVLYTYVFLFFTLSRGLTALYIGEKTHAVERIFKK